MRAIQSALRCRRWRRRWHERCPTQKCRIDFQHSTASLNSFRILFQNILCERERGRERECSSFIKFNKGRMNEFDALSAWAIYGSTPCLHFILADYDLVFARRVTKSIVPRWDIFFNPTHLSVGWRKFMTQYKLYIRAHWPLLWFRVVATKSARLCMPKTYSNWWQLFGIAGSLIKKKHICNRRNCALWYAWPDSLRRS